MYQVNLSPDHIRIIIAGLGELPTKVSFDTLVALKVQVEQQNAKAAAEANAEKVDD